MELEVKDIKKGYGRKKVLEGLSLWAKAGECTGIVGANGCGKSTLLRILAGTEKADGGKIFLDGKEAGGSRTMAARIGYIPQESALISELTVADNLKLWAGFGDYRENQKRLKELCGQFDIDSFYGERVKNLSGGMCRRVNIVCALIHGPSILLMDEPSAALDLVFKEELKGYIRDFIGKGGSVLLCSHDAGEIALCQKVWAIKGGKAFEVSEGMSVQEMVGKYMR
ncbi:MAG: ABC transporter ATP-binding protein [Clostridium sp.]|nr:ABC transporter ATP-binding protein [Clostridium sp.]